jgi:hypothetical protein
LVLLLRQGEFSLTLARAYPINEFEIRQFICARGVIDTVIFFAFWTPN